MDRENLGISARAFKGLNPKINKPIVLKAESIEIRSLNTPNTSCEVDATPTA